MEARIARGWILSRWLNDQIRQKGGALTIRCDMISLG